MKKTLQLALVLALNVPFAAASAQTTQSTAPVYGPPRDEPQRSTADAEDDQYRLPRLREPTAEERTDCRVGIRRLGLRFRCGSADSDRDRPAPTQPGASGINGRRL